MNFKSSILASFVAGVLISAPLLTVRTPDELQKWMSTNLTYQSEVGDYWKSPEETIKDKGGDCEDLAILASRVLNDLRIENKLVYIIYMADNKTDAKGHIICVYKTFEGNYNVFTNTELIKTPFQSLPKLIRTYWPRWTRAGYVNIKKHDYYNWIYPPPRLK
jgi:hypothetical protein